MPAVQAVLFVAEREREATREAAVPMRAATAVMMPVAVMTTAAVLLVTVAMVVMAGGKPVRVAVPQAAAQEGASLQTESTEQRPHIRS